MADSDSVCLWYYYRQCLWLATRYASVVCYGEPRVAETESHVELYQLA